MVVQPRRLPEESHRRERLATKDRMTAIAYSGVIATIPATSRVLIR